MPLNHFRIARNRNRPIPEIRGDSMRYMLDTNICIYAIQHKPLSVIAALRSHAAEGIGLSTISVAG